MADDAHRTLVEQATHGDASALETLVERHLPGLLRYLRVQMPGHLRRRESLSDLAQSVCREVLAQATDVFDGNEGAFRHWLFRKARDKIVEKQRYHYADKRSPVHEERGSEAGCVVAGNDPTPSQQAIRSEELDRLERAFEHLKDDDRQVITLSRIVGLSHAEIAAEMGRSEGAVRVLLHRALARLGTAMNETGDAPE